MVRRRLLFGAAAILALAGARPAAAGAITFATGDVEKDMPSDAAGVTTIVNHPYAGTNISNPNAVWQADWITQKGWINGRVIKDMRVYYDQGQDRLYVGVNFFGVAGDADGNGVVGTSDPKFAGQEYSHLGVFNKADQSSIAVGIDLTGSHKPTVVAGIAADKGVIGPGTDGFIVTSAGNTSGGLAYAFGGRLDANNGNLAFEPSKDHPDFEFSIPGLSKIPGFDINKGIGLMAYSGSNNDIDVGEDNVPYTHLSLENLNPPQKPEPATLMAWSVVVAGATWRGVASRRRKGGPRASA